MKILQNNSNYTFVDVNVGFLNKLPNKIFSIEYSNSTQEFFLKEEEFDKFKVPSKIYGSCDAIADKVLTKYNKRSKNLGVLLQGVKGSGKSLTSKLICNRLEAPVLILKHWFTDTNLMEFLSNINQEFVLFIDEFEKIFNSTKDQATILPLFDEWSNNKILFLLTANGENNANVSNYLVNRPSRIHYKIQFSSLTVEDITSIIDDCLNNKEHKESILKLSNIVGNINIDVLISIIEEVNDTDNSDVNELLNYLNIEPDNSRYNSEIINKAENWKVEFAVGRNPLVSGFYVNEIKQDLITKRPVLLNNEHTYLERSFSVEDYKTISVTSNGYRMTVEDMELIFTRLHKTSLVF